MAVDLATLKRKPQADEYIGARVTADLKERLQAVCERERVSVATLLTALVEDFLKGKENEHE